MQALAALLASRITQARFIAKVNAGDAGPLSCAAQRLLHASCNIVTLGNSSTNRHRKLLIRHELFKSPFVLSLSKHEWALGLRQAQAERQSSLIRAVSIDKLEATRSHAMALPGRSGKRHG